MWILESSGDFLQGKRMWLKPGKKYLFGRVKKDGVRFAIDHKTVSRKHFVISIEDVKDEYVGQVHARSKITISDEDSKAGTNIDGQLLKGKSQELTKDTTSIRPGTCPHELLIKWVPCVLSFHLLKKEIKSGVLKFKQERVKELDIKAISDFLPDTTTHLIVQKRNTPKGLQALIDAVPLVTESFIDALIYAATPSDLGEEENLCPLEMDFDDAWPDSAPHLPPPGKEPTSKPAEAYQPNTARHKIFENFTFVFLDQSQYDNLLPPISLGHGKASLLKIVPEQTTVEDVIRFMQNVAGQKHFGDANKSQDRGGVIMVRKNIPDDPTNNIVNKVSVQLEQRAIDQGDFLDAILANDAFTLRQAVPFETYEDHGNCPSPTAVSSTAKEETGQKSRSEPQSVAYPDRPSREDRAPESDATLQQTASNHMSTLSHDKLDPHSSVESAQEEVVKPTKRNRFIPTSKTFKKFDDDFDPDSIAAYEEVEELSTAKPLSISQNFLASRSVESDEESIKQENGSPRKRRRSSSPLYNENDGMDDFLPGATAMKKQRLANKVGVQRRGLSTGARNADGTSFIVRKPKKELAELDVREAVRARRKAEDDAAKRAVEEVEDLADNESKGPADLAQIHELELPVRERNAETVSHIQSDRWDPKWNGRKNFKKFRRARELSNDDKSESRTSHTKLIVPVAEIKRSTYGIGDQYWQKSPSEKERQTKEKEKRKRAAAKATHSQTPTRSGKSHNGHVTDDSSDDVQSDANDDGNIIGGSPHQTSPQLDRLQQEAAEVLDQPVDLDAPRRTRAGDTQNQTQTSTGRKRPASGTPAGRGNTDKKQKTLPVAVIHGSQSESDDSDDMKFKFGRGRKGQEKRKT